MPENDKKYFSPTGFFGKPGIWPLTWRGRSDIISVEKEGATDRRLAQDYRFLIKITAPWRWAVIFALGKNLCRICILHQSR